ncbi:MAG: serine/threonine protein kinase [Proteobacteria bacterium]|nr:serine/threonine protein kinase [Pseudomonadota bacterium]
MAQVRRQRRKTRQSSSPNASAMPACSAHPQQPGDGRFYLESLLGSGGMCEVYSALDLRRVEWGDANPRVAVKRLLPALAQHPQAQVALAQEFCVLRHLVHPGVVRVFDLHKEPFGICLSMELLEGRTAYVELGAYPDGLGMRAIQATAKLFGVLAFLHGQGVIHGDIKPANLFLAPEGRVALLDFNVASVTARPGAASSPVAQGLRETLRLPAHSLLHASPERLSTGRPSAADDVFSACCTAYELLTGRHPFKGRSAQEAQQQGMIAEKPDILTRRQWEPLGRGLAFAPQDRLTAAELHKRFTVRGVLRRLAAQWSHHEALPYKKE